jgi:hypothetical protein
MRPSERCALDIRRGRGSRECWQIVCAHLRGGLVSRRELDQSGFAESCPEEANAERHAKYYAGGNLNNGITGAAASTEVPKMKWSP